MIVIKVILGLVGLALVFWVCSKVADALVANKAYHMADHAMAAGDVKTGMELVEIGDFFRESARSWRPSWWPPRRRKGAT